jgi:hypothetical protein
VTEIIKCNKSINIKKVSQDNLPKSIQSILNDLCMNSMSELKQAEGKKNENLPKIR